MPWVRLGILAFGLTLCVYLFPSALSDKNTFLQDFLDNDLLSVLGFIAAVTLGSLGNIYLQVSQVERSLGRELKASKKALKYSAGSIIIAFGLAFLLLIVKPLLPSEGVYIAASNSVAIALVYVYLEILWDITFTTFRVGDASKSI